MRPSLLCFLAVVIVILLLHQHPTEASVEDACASAARRDPRTIDYNYCVASLQADPGSGSADTRGLAVIAARLALANATSTRSMIQKLLAEQPPDPNTGACLHDCLDLYADTSIPGLADSIHAIESDRLDDARTYLSSALDAPGDCESGFTDKSVASPLTKENHDCKELSAIALAITVTLE